MQEKQNIEWKESWRDEYFKWICGFANAQGGKIYIGKNDKGKVVGIDNAKRLIDDHKSDELGLTPEEYAFYSVLNENESTSFLDDDKMKELIHIIVDVIRKNATVDWSKRDDVRAKLKLTVKKILMRYGYPPDLAKLEADRVLAQGESLVEMFSTEN